MRDAALLPEYLKLQMPIFVENVFKSFFTIILAELKRASFRSCRHVHPSNRDGEYSIDPTLSGNPFTVYCDMTTDGGK